MLQSGMAWRLVDPQYYAARLREDGEGGSRTVFWYQDDSSLDLGELVFWLDPAGAVEEFHLSYARWPRGKEHLAEWRRGGILRIGEVESGDADGGYGTMRRNMTPIVRRHAAVDPAILAEVRSYFERQATVLSERQREGIAAVLAGPPSKAKA